MIAKIVTASAIALALAACDSGRDNQTARSDKPATTAGSTTSPSSTASSSTSPSTTTGSSATGAAGKPGTADSSDTTLGKKVDDTMITSKVKTALMADPDIKGMSINVDTVKGEVKLSGNVKSDDQIKKAMEIARGVEGVTGVQNNLKVKTSG